jgi:hypothetical protein
MKNRQWKSYGYIYAPSIPPKACDYCKKWDRLCLTYNPQCLNTNGVRVYRTGTKPGPDATIVGIVGPRLTNYLVRENSHPQWKNRRKKFVRNSARQKRKERRYTR